MLVLVSDHDSDGNSTYSAVFMLRCGYSGNNVTASLIVENGNGKVGSKTFSCSDDGKLVLNGRGRYLIMRNF